MNDVGEPCAGEPHARFERGPLARRASTAKRNTRTRRETRGTGPARLPANEQPAAYLTEVAEAIASTDPRLSQGRRVRMRAAAWLWRRQ